MVRRGGRWPPIYAWRPGSRIQHQFEVNEKPRCRIYLSCWQKDEGSTKFWSHGTAWMKTISWCDIKLFGYNKLFYCSEIKSHIGNIIRNILIYKKIGCRCQIFYAFWWKSAKLIISTVKILNLPFDVGKYWLDNVRRRKGCYLLVQLSLLFFQCKKKAQNHRFYL